VSTKNTLFKQIKERATEYFCVRTTYKPDSVPFLRQ